MDTKVTVVIPYYESDPEKPAILKRCTDSLVGHDELIVVWNDKMGYAKAINKGLALAKGDYIVVMNDDVILKRGSLQQLCYPGVVTSPMFDGHKQPFWGSCFCIPSSVYKEVGGLYEGYDISYYDDDDYIYTLRKAGISMSYTPDVEFNHPEGGRTLHTFSNWTEFENKNREHFKERWGEYPNHQW